MARHDKPKQRSGRKPAAGEQQFSAAQNRTVSDHQPDRMAFCFGCQQPNYSLDELSAQQREKFIMALHKRRDMTWTQLILNRKQGLGTEWLRRSALYVSPPPAFADRERFLAFKYDGSLRVVGARVEQVFHVLWIAADITQLYDHGS